MNSEMLNVEDRWLATGHGALLVPGDALPSYSPKELMTNNCVASMLQWLLKRGIITQIYYTNGDGRTTINLTGTGVPARWGTRIPSFDGASLCMALALACQEIAVP